MPTELEAKFAVEAHESLRERLCELGAEYVGRVCETNTIHDRSKGKLRKAGCGLRVRGIEVLDGAPQEATLTFKGPVQKAAFKQRDEIELPIGEAEDMRRLLEAIGFGEVFRFEKRRESWRLESSRVELDELPCLGLFVEIEGPTESDILAAQEALGLRDAKHISRGYVSMLALLRARSGGASSAYTFR
ncbi:MAG: class IV adenylate cyclase [bacterium]|nr:class IV adenylate cyclase [bacterium]